MLLGDKMAAKAAAVDAGVPTSPVFDHEVLSAAAGGEGVDSLSFPLLVKAAGGGGGRGMRVVQSLTDLGEAVDAASREAKAAFGDATVFAEPYLAGGRHIEVQIFGDHHGNVIHLGERDCSVQRRNQKIIEESPAPGLDDATRQRLLDGAVSLARHVGYRNAGTVEFLVGAGGEINFLEVNTRLQVEHPVTEAVTGLDLVELQLRVASGEPLPPVPLGLSGHAIEVRLVAESPSQGWLPSTGRLELFDLDLEGATNADNPVRVDAGFRRGDEVTPYYDSLLAKLIVHRPTRAEAAAVLAAHLRRVPIAGVATNRSALTGILSEDDFLAGRLSTGYLDAHPEVVEPDDVDPALVLAATIYLDRFHRSSDRRTGFAPTGWRNVPTVGQRLEWELDAGEPSVDSNRMAVEYRSCGDQAVHQTVRGLAAVARIGPFPEPTDDGTLSEDNRPSFDIRLLSIDLDHKAEPAGHPSATSRSAVLGFEVDGVRRRVTVQHRTLEPTGPGAGSDEPVELVVVSSASGSVALQSVPRFETPSLDGSVGSGPVCPLPGTVIAVHVEAGQTVGEGDVLVVVEAMKMEHKITASTPAKVIALPFAVGDRVDAGDLLVELGSAPVVG